MKRIGLDIVIVGGGIGGLMAALSLHQAGHSPVIYEAAPALEPLGVGINLLPHAMRELTELGLLEEFLALPHARVVQAGIDIGARHYRFADLSRLPVPCNFIAMPKGKGAGVWSLR